MIELPKLNMQPQLQNNGGQIAVESAVGAGSTFSFTIPIRPGMFTQ